MEALISAAHGSVAPAGDEGHERADMAGAAGEKVVGQLVGDHPLVGP